jgi:hypothetical protein
MALLPKCPFQADTGAGSSFKAAGPLRSGQAGSYNQCLMSKKWYNLFISVDPGPGTSGDQPESDDSSSSDARSAAEAVADIAASIQPVDAKLAPMMAPPAPPPGSPPSAKPAAPAAPLSFNEIYNAAEINPPAHGYTILKVADMLKSPHIAALPAEVKRSSVLVALEAAGVKITDIVQDAVRRDKALDTFERLQQKQVEDFEAVKLEENRKLQAELDRFVAEQKAKIKANTEDAEKRKESFYSWRVQKQIEEQKIADAVSHFVTENPITTSGRSSSLPPSKPGTGI